MNVHNPKKLKNMHVGLSASLNSDKTKPKAEKAAQAAEALEALEKVRLEAEELASQDEIYAEAQQNDFAAVPAFDSDARFQRVFTIIRQ
ncbi:hypothetical protein MY11210_001511 [Beauveria gryllotalpidicola]